MKKGDIIKIKYKGEERDAVIESIEGDIITVSVSEFVSIIDNGNDKYKWDEKEKKFNLIYKYGSKFQMQ